MRTGHVDTVEANRPPVLLPQADFGHAPLVGRGIDGKGVKDRFDNNAFPIHSADGTVTAFPTSFHR